MITLMQMWIPIVGSAIVVFVLSSLVHMVFKWHNADYRQLANEDEVRSAIRKANPAPGQYVVPYCVDMKQMGSPEMQKKYADGPVAFLTLKQSGPPQMGPALVKWFVYVLVLGVFAAYLASRTLPAGASFAHVFRLVATVLFLAYVGGSVQYAIWMGKPWSSAAKDALDGAIYAAATGAVFGCLWPQ